MSLPVDLTRNALLARLPADSARRLAPHLEFISLSANEPLLETGGRINYALFPTTCVVSLMFLSADGGTYAVTTVGREGMVGVALLMGGLDAPVSTVVQCAGDAIGIPAAALLEEFNRGDVAQHVLLRYVYARMLGSIQMTHCVRHHTVEQQLCRWLLEMLDRQAMPDLTMTQEQIAASLGVRREAVTAAAGHLQQAGWIHYRRGRITVLDRAGLESHVCECYEALRHQLKALEANLPEGSDSRSVTHAQSTRPTALIGQSKSNPSATRSSTNPTPQRKRGLLLRAPSPLLAR